LSDANTDFAASVLSRAAIYFELVAGRTSTMMQFEPSTGKAAPVAMPVPADSMARVVSPDGHWIPYESTMARRKFGSTIFAAVEIGVWPAGNCNNSSPAWQLDSRTILFASDCGRAFGLPALYRAKLSQK